MTEKEKAQAGLLYKSTEEELKSELMRCKTYVLNITDLCHHNQKKEKLSLKNSWQDRRKFLDRAIILVRLWL